MPPSGKTVRSHTADLLLRGAANFKGSVDQVVQLLAKVLNRHKDAEEGCAAYLVLYIERVKSVYMNESIVIFIFLFGSQHVYIFTYICTQLYLHI